MNSNEILSDLAQRPIDAANALPPLTPGQLNAHPSGHPNSIAWLLWHSGREVDVQLADLTGGSQVWEKFRGRFGLGHAGDAVGYGQSPEDAEAIVVEDQGLLVEYLEAALMAVRQYTGSLSDDDLDEIIDSNWTPPVTRGVRLISIIDDAIQHVAQAAYVAGAPTK
ncbi:DinB family protein [Galactobacter sp.]|uniref:mycothiol transferase n=1 Tax=Galactobacter sp. TaxID=2676125 RepID=UPI0025C0D8CE|nr:DinB family protein [Galactobacter sp.]